MPTGWITSILALASCLVLRQCGALQCLECNNIPHPSLCTTMTECVDTSKCFIQQQYYALSGFHLFSMGCMSREKCQQMSYLNSTRSDSILSDAVLWTPPDDVTLTHSGDVRAKRSDEVVTCTDCCDGNEFCNMAGCGAIADNSSSRGLYCYDCDTASFKQGCRDIKQCDLGYVCSVERSSFPGFYSARCVPQSDCTTPLIGRRAAPRIPYCCNQDFCNTPYSHNTTAAVAATVTSPWSSWTDWSSCSVSCGNGLHHRIRVCEAHRGGEQCTGASTEHGRCRMAHCQQTTETGHWEQWSRWSRCSVTCGHGRKFRVRSCINGVHCAGASRQYYWCHPGQCTNVVSPSVRCFECTDVPDPAACSTVTQCDQNSACFTKKYITSAGFSLYSSGCISLATCDGLRATPASDEAIQSSKRAAGDVTLCEDCCTDREFCNNEGCGTQVHNLTARGPYCFVCNQNAGHSRCTKVQQCQLGEVCVTRTTADGAYITGCVPKSQCPSDHHGKRATAPVCCDTDFCNDLVDHKPANLTQVSADAWLSWSDWSACSVTCGAGYQQRNRRCSSTSGANCPGTNLEKTYCNAAHCPDSTVVRCFECKDVPDPAACSTVTECVAPSVCYVRRYITTSGNLLYASGCRSKELCDVIDSRQSAKRRRRDTSSENDVTVCEECCRTGDFCNSRGCNGTAFSSTKRGPYCFACSVQNTAYGCRTVRQCPHGWVCSLQQSMYNGLYTSGCIKERSCPHISTTRRASQLPRAASQAPYCCRGDYCNEFVHHNITASLIG